MAEKKHNWTKIKKDWLAGKYKNIKDLADKNNISYSYCKKQVAKWNKEKKIAEKLINPQIEEVGSCDRHTSKEDGDIKVPSNKEAVFINDIEVPTQEVIVPTKVTTTLSKNRNIWLSSLWDRLGLIVETALSEPEHNFFTLDGRVKTKQLTDIALILEKIQKANEGKANKKTGQLSEYVEMFELMKQAHGEEVED
ncbi:hypothetical protein [Clostridium chrysemydis]|uniref:hypothetical protein n=1 Tax=Clostridium chrysemydis TaxID=2665504 RepID=UPI001884815F|nr:hypothetical protein [Clostridium chrysemydis]